MVFRFPGGSENAVWVSVFPGLGESIDDAAVGQQKLQISIADGQNPPVLVFRARTLGHESLRYRRKSKMLSMSRWFTCRRFRNQSLQRSLNIVPEGIYRGYH